MKTNLFYVKVITALLLIHRVFGNKYMLMGGTLIQFLTDLRLSGDITEGQYKVITNTILEGKDISFQQHRANTDQVVGAQTSIDLTNYIDAQAKAGKMTVGTAEYLHALFNLDEDETFPPAAALADYNGNGIIDLLSWLDFDPPASGESYNGIWGYSAGSREYALACNSNGLHIIDVTNAENPVRVQFIEMDGGTIWRDVAVHDHYAYVAAQSGGNFWVVDLTNLSTTTTPDGKDSNPIPSSGYIDRGRTNYGHTLNVADGLLYLNSAGGLGCQIFDLLENPWDPPLINSWSGSGRDCHDSFARNGVELTGGIGPRNLLYSADGYSRSFRIVDITEVRSGAPPQLLGATAAISGIYAHQNCLSDNNKYLYTFDEFKVHDIGVWDVSDPSSISLVTTFQWSGDELENSIVHNGQVRGSYLHVAYYEAGYRVFDISNPANPVEVGKYETYRDPDGDGSLQNSITGQYEGAWNLYTLLPSGNVLVSDRNNGLFVLNANKVPVPDAPASLAATVSSNAVVLQWSASSGATGYSVKRSLSTGEPYDIIAMNVMGSSYTDSTVEDMEYFYIVAATNAEGESNASNEVSVDLTQITPAPTLAPTPAPTLAPTPAPTSAPGVCGPEETCSTDPLNCISGTFPGAKCGNGVCETGDGEDCSSCPADCNGRLGGKPSARYCCGSTVTCSDQRCGLSCRTTPNPDIEYCCGDGKCNGAEDFLNCPNDCDPPVPTSAPTALPTPNSNCGGKGITCREPGDCCSNICKRNGRCG